MLRINEAAMRLGVTPTTLRRWESAGEIHPLRTAGGERRYPESEIARLLAKASQKPQTPVSRAADEFDEFDESVEAAPVEYVTDDEEPPLALPQAPRRDARVDEAKANLRVRRIELERESLDRSARENAERRERRARELAQAEAGQQAKAREKADDDQRLEQLRQHGDMLAAIAGAPMSLRAEITKDLVAYVTPSRFPRSASAQGYLYVQARVEKLLSSWRIEQERAAQQEADAREDARRRQQRKELIQAGLSHADSATQLWDARDRSEVASDVKDRLYGEVDDSWDRYRVIELVDEILGEWD